MTFQWGPFVVRAAVDVACSLCGCLIPRGARYRWTYRMDNSGRDRERACHACAK